MSEFSKAKQILEEVQRAQDRLADEIGRKCDWDDPLDVAVYRRAERTEERLEAVNRLAPGGLCPTCRESTPYESWVLNKNKTKITCRTCFHNALKKLGSVEEAEIFSIFLEPEIKFRIDGKALAETREKAGLSGRDFGKRAGWSHSRQRQLELGDVQTVSLAIAETIIQVLREAEEKGPSPKSGRKPGTVVLTDEYERSTDTRCINISDD